MKARRAPSPVRARPKHCEQSIRLLDRRGEPVHHWAAVFIEGTCDLLALSVKVFVPDLKMCVDYCWNKWKMHRWGNSRFCLFPWFISFYFGFMCNERWDDALEPHRGAQWEETSIPLYIDWQHSICSVRIHSTVHSAIVCSGSSMRPGWRNWLFFFLSWTNTFCLPKNISEILSRNKFHRGKPLNR